MNLSIRLPLLLAALCGPGATALTATSDDPLAPWRAAVEIRPVSAEPGRHTIHTYYLTCPESPDGTRVLFFASTTPAGHHGDLIVRERACGQETVIAGGPAGHWGVAVCDVRGGQFQILHRFDNSRGAKSWRKNHPHPMFSPDGKRIYFNVNEGDWTQLLVAQSAP